MQNQNQYFWLQHKQLICAPAKLIRKELNKIILEDIDGLIVEQNEEQSLLIHPSCFNGEKDLLYLSDFNEFSSLHNIRIRYEKDQIYTRVGQPILVALNPYKKLPLYTKQIAKQYKQQMNNYDLDQSNIEPHLFYISELSFQQLFEQNNNQAIVISGESGSGKTESTKIILQYLANDQTSHLEIKLKDKQKNVNPSVEEQILDSNPLLEAFGNAQTVRNDNSSRFGKFIRVLFNNQRKIQSAQIMNYLLEQSRVVKVSPFERSYHIFYLIFHQTKEIKQQYYLKESKDYNYINKGDLKIKQEDIINFQLMSNCMDVLNISESEKDSIFKIVSGILQIGNLDFSSCVEDDSAILTQKSQLFHLYASQMFGIEKEELLKLITTKKILDPTNKQFIFKKQNKIQAYNNRDSLSKAIYSKLFDWLIVKVNIALHKGDMNNLNEIGILDIFGFEIFEENSFEQLCINFTNEKLQQHFNLHMFKLEQSEYNQEDIEWKHIKFTDNQITIDLFDKNPNCIYGIIDDVGKQIKSTDSMIVARLFNNISNTQLFNAGNKGNAGMFGVHHFAGDVIYQVDDFLEKNKDSSSDDFGEIIQKSTNKLLEYLFQKQGDNIQKKKQISVSQNFRSQLDQLIQKLNSSNPLYIRCIKPNNLKQPNNIDSKEVLRQLKCAGLLEAIRIRKAGYAIRRQIKEFLGRYKVLQPKIASQLNELNGRQIATQFMTQLSQINVFKEKLNPKLMLWQVGKSKIFMKEEIKNLFDTQLNQFYKKYVIIIQKNTKTFQQRKKFQLIQKKIIKIQKQMKNILFRKQISTNIKKLKFKGQKILSIFKMNFCKRKYQKQLKILIFQKQQQIILQKQNEEMIQKQQLLNQYNKEQQQQQQFAYQYQNKQQKFLDIDEYDDIQQYKINQNSNTNTIITDDIQQQKFKIENYLFQNEQENNNSLKDLESQLIIERQEKEQIQNELKSMRLSINMDQMLSQSGFFQEIQNQFKDKERKSILDPLVKSKNIGEFIQNFSESESKIQELQMQLESSQKKLQRIKNEKDVEIFNEKQQKEQLNISLQNQMKENLILQKQIQLYKNQNENSELPKIIKQLIQQKQEILQQLKQKQIIIDNLREKQQNSLIESYDNIANLKKQQEINKVLKQELDQKDEELEEKSTKITSQEKLIGDLNKELINFQTQQFNLQNQLHIMEEEINNKNQKINLLNQKIEDIEQKAYQMSNNQNSQQIDNEHNFQNIHIEYKRLSQLKNKQEQINNGNKEIVQTLVNLLKWKSIEVEHLKNALKKFEIQEESELYQELANVKSKEGILMDKLQKQMEKVKIIEKEMTQQ